MLSAAVQSGLFVTVSLLFHVVLLAHFAMRRWRFQTAVRFGWVVYALSIPFAVVSALLLLSGAPWWMTLGGLLYLVWAAFGLVVEYVLHVQWRSPVRVSILLPYLALYLATAMFYWWPLGRIGWGYWAAATVLFVAGTTLNLGSHRPGPALAAAVRGSRGTAER